MDESAPRSSLTKCCRGSWFSRRATLAGGLVVSLLMDEKAARLAIKKVVSKQVMASLDSGSDSGEAVTLSERLQRDFGKLYKNDSYKREWAGLKRSHPQWIESTYQKTLKSEVEHRVEQKRLAGDAYGALGSIDRICDSGSRVVKEGWTVWSLRSQMSRLRVALHCQRASGIMVP